MGKTSGGRKESKGKREGALDIPSVDKACTNCNNHRGVSNEMEKLCMLHNSAIIKQVILLCTHIS